MPAAPPEIGPYRVLGPLGHGGMGTVWLAEDPRLARRVAIKLFAGPEARTEYARDQLLREARAAAALNHANIASVHDVVDVDGQVAVVFEYVEGETLAVRIARGPLSVSATLGVALQLADALCCAHEQGIVHRDLKPPNVVVTRDGAVKVLDFGVARVLPAGTAGSLAARTTAGGFVGTIGYAAPEQCLGEPGDARADMFSLGVVIYEALTGQRPFPGADATTVMRKILQDAPPRVGARVRDFPEPLDGLIARLLAAEPDRRPQTAREVRDTLQAIAPALPGSLARPAPRRRAWATAALLGTALVTGALVSSLASNRPASSAPKAPVVAVMPLTNASGDSSKDYLALGIADGLITRLAALPTVTVLSRAAVTDLRHRKLDVPSMASELDASYFVDGTVSQVADMLTIHLSLVRRDGSVAWADTVDGPFDSIFVLQTRLASALGKALAVQLSAADRASLAQQPTMSAEALAAYWRGKAFLERRDVKGNVQAGIAAFDEAVAIDPRFADAHAARGEAFWARYGETSDPAFVQQAIAAGSEALRLNPHRPQVRYSMALTLEGNGRLEQAVEELQHALVLQPNFDEARRRLGQVLARMGRIDEAVAEYEKAIALRPNFWGHYLALGTSLLQAARYADAVKALQRVTELQPESFIGYHQLGTAYQLLGDQDRALIEFNRAIEISPNPATLANIGAIYHLRGRYRDAEVAYRRSLALRPNAHITHRNLGDSLVRQGKRADALQAYGNAVASVEAALTINPNDVENSSALAVYLAKLGRGAEALEQIERARRLAPANARIMFRKGVVHALLGDRSAALSALESSVSGGYSRRSLAQEEDLEPLRREPAFQALIAEGH